MIIVPRSLRKRTTEKTQVYLIKCYLRTFPTRSVLVTPIIILDVTFRRLPPHARIYENMGYARVANTGAWHRQWKTR